jgi:hypothetical protein
MKKLSLLLAIYALACGAALAQTLYPYQTGFDTPAGQAGWAEYRTGHAHSYKWNMGGCTGHGAPSAPNCIFHDYPVGGSPAQLMDWYVSPKFDFSNGGRVDAVSAKIYAIMGSATPTDHFGIYLLKGDPDPAKATATTLIADLTGNVSNASTWATYGPYTIASTTGDCYIAFKYMAQDNWFTINFDDVKISHSKAPAGISTVAGGEINMYPNPVNDVLQLTGLTKGMTIQISDLSGRQIIHHTATAQNETINTAHLPIGMFMITIIDNGNKYTTRLLKQ